MKNVLTTCLLFSLTTMACGSDEPVPADDSVALTTADDPSAAYAACRYDIDFTLMGLKLRFPPLGEKSDTSGHALRVDVEMIYGSDPDWEDAAIAYVEGIINVEGRPWSFRCIADLIIDEDGRRGWDVFSSPSIIAPARETVARVSGEGDQ